MTWTTYNEYLAELAKRKSWKVDPLIEEQRRELIKEEKSYVYVIRDPRPGKNLCPIYVGKGQGRRAFVHVDYPRSRSGALPHIITKCQKLGLTPPIEIVAYFETEEAAFQHEVELIAKYGRRNLGTGTLCNLTDGGEGTSGWIPSEVYREKLRERMLTMHENPEFVASLRAGNKLWWAEKENMEAHSARMRVEMVKPERLAQITALAKQYNEDPSFRALRAETLRDYNAIFEFHASPLPGGSPRRRISLALLQPTPGDSTRSLTGFRR